MHVALSAKYRAPAVAVAGLSFRVFSRGIFLSHRVPLGIVVSLWAGRVQHVSVTVVAWLPINAPGSRPPPLSVCYRLAQGAWLDRVCRR